jgi:lysylphosphatidylglycerol synthetase-like protein (DUF2156 family)
MCTRLARLSFVWAIAAFVSIGIGFYSLLRGGEFIMIATFVLGLMLLVMARSSFERPDEGRTTH